MAGSAASALGVLAAAGLSGLWGAGAVAHAASSNEAAAAVVDFRGKGRTGTAVGSVRDNGGGAWKLRWQARSGVWPVRGRYPGEQGTLGKSPAAVASPLSPF